MRRFHRYLIFGSRWICVVCLASTVSPNAGAQLDLSGPTAFRVRSDFSVGLNSNEGWAGALNERVAVYADRPFRVRFEVGSAKHAATPHEFRLQYRRNGAEWNDVEAHDFPHPVAEADFDFESLDIGATPKAWRIEQGKSGALAITADRRRKFLHARGSQQQPLIALYSAPWALTEFEFEASFRLATSNRPSVGFIFGFVDADNYGRVFLDQSTGLLTVSRIVNGAHTVLAREHVETNTHQWHQLELDFEDGELEVNYGDDTLEFTVELGHLNPTAPLGVYVPANSRVYFHEINIEGDPKTPRVSIVSCSAYENGAATTDLLKSSATSFRAGVGVSNSGYTSSWTGEGQHGEFEWALVVRRFADGGVTNEQGDLFELRMVDSNGKQVSGSPHAVVRLSIPPRHVGGTFVETPGRIGPFQSTNGDLYFIMEPAETDNLFMVIKSVDQGRTWREVDGANRPTTGDLESVDARLIGDTLHIIHQVTNSTRYHAFRTSDHPSQPDTWSVRDELAASAEAIAQATALVVRSDGSLVTFYVGQTKVHYNIRSPKGVWGQEVRIDPGVGPNTAGPQAVLGANDTIHLAYYGTDGTIWYRQLLPTGSMTKRRLLTRGAGTTRAEYGAVLPLLFIPEKNTVVIIYRLASGQLWERRIVNEGPPTPAVRITNRQVVTDAVDSQQPAADAVLDGHTIHLLFIEPNSRSIFSTHDSGGWHAATLQVDNIVGSWVRGNVYTRPDGKRVYGYVYDAGSEGGAGMNRFGEQQLPDSLGTQE